MPQPPDTLEGLLRLVMKRATGSVHTAIPGRVLSYDKDTQKATVLPAVQSKYVDADTGELVDYEVRPIPNCPVLFPQGGGFAITWPLEPDDDCTIIYAERSIDEWLATGNASNQAQDSRRHDYSDALVLPAGRPFARPLEETAEDSMVVEIPESEFITFGDAAVSTFLARADRVEARLQALEAWATDVKSKFDDHHHTGTSPADKPKDSGVTIVLDPVPSTSSGDTAADKVKGD